jgi:hypothetical protein
MSQQANPYIVMLTNVRASFPTLLKPEASFKDGPLKFSCDFLMPPDHPDLQRMYSVIQLVAADKWKEQAQAVLSMIQAERKFRCFGRGEERINQKKMVPYDGYPGMFYVTGLSDSQPVLVQEDGTPVDARNQMAVQAEVRKIYGGCYVNACIKFFPQNNEAGRAIRCELIAVQFLSDGQPFGEGPIDLTGMFSAVPGAGAAQQMPGFAPQPQQVPPHYAPPPQPQQVPPHYAPPPQPQMPAPPQYAAPQQQMPAPPQYAAPQQQMPAPPQQGFGFPPPTGQFPIPGHN